MQDKS